MATWKKIIVSGSTAVLGGVNLPSLTTNNLVIVGASGALTNSGITLSSSTASFGAVALTNTSAASSLSGSFSGSFTGTFSGTTDLPDLTDGNGIADFTYDGSDVASVAIQISGSTLDLGANGVRVANAGITADQLATSVAGTGLAGGGGTALSVDLNEVGAATVNVANDSIVFIDADGSNATKKESIADLAAAMAGTNLDSANGQINLPTTITGAHTFDNNLTVSGNLTVDGTTTTLNTANLLVEDRFILLNSGSADPDEGGIIIDEGGGSGSAFIYDASDTRWGFNANVSSSQATANSNAYAAQVIDENNSAHTGAVSASYVANGNIRIATNGDIFIYS